MTSRTNRTSRAPDPARPAQAANWVTGTKNPNASGRRHTLIANQRPLPPRLRLTAGRYPRAPSSKRARPRWMRSKTMSVKTNRSRIPDRRIAAIGSFSGNHARKMPVVNVGMPKYFTAP